MRARERGPLKCRGLPPAQAPSRIPPPFALSVAPVTATATATANVTAVAVTFTEWQKHAGRSSLVFHILVVIVAAVLLAARIGLALRSGGEGART